MTRYTGCEPLSVTEEQVGAKSRDPHERIAELEIAVRRGIAELERIVPYVQWDGLDGEQDEAHAHATLKLMRAAV